MNADTRDTVAWARSAPRLGGRRGRHRQRPKLIAERAAAPVQATAKVAAGLIGSAALAFPAAAAMASPGLAAPTAVHTNLAAFTVSGLPGTPSGAGAGTGQNPLAAAFATLAPPVQADGPVVPVSGTSAGDSPFMVAQNSNLLPPPNLIPAPGSSPLPGGIPTNQIPANESWIPGGSTLHLGAADFHVPYNMDQSLTLTTRTPANDVPGVDYTWYSDGAGAIYMNFAHISIPGNRDDTVPLPPGVYYAGQTTIVVKGNPPAQLEQPQSQDPGSIQPQNQGTPPSAEPAPGNNTDIPAGPPYGGNGSFVPSPFGAAPQTLNGSAQVPLGPGSGIVFRDSNGFPFVASNGQEIPSIIPSAGTYSTSPGDMQLIFQDANPMIPIGLPGGTSNPAGPLTSAAPVPYLDPTIAGMGGTVPGNGQPAEIGSSPNAQASSAFNDLNSLGGGLAAPGTGSAQRGIQPSGAVGAVPGSPDSGGAGADGVNAMADSGSGASASPVAGPGGSGPATVVAQAGSGDSGNGVMSSGAPVTGPGGSASTDPGPSASADPGSSSPPSAPADTSPPSAPAAPADTSPPSAPADTSPPPAPAAPAAASDSNPQPPPPPDPPVYVVQDSFAATASG